MAVSLTRGLRRDVHTSGMDVIAKLQIKPDQQVAVVASPAVEVPRVVGERATPLAAPGTADVVVAFVLVRADLAGVAAPALDAARKDRLAWIAYPKAGKLDTDLNRDILARALATEGVQPVRQVAIDEMWSALRFRPALGTPVAALTARARELWEYLAGTPVRFTPAISVAVSPRSYLCPPGWASIVVIGDAALATAPDPETARLVGQALSGLPAASLTGAGVLRRRLPIAEIRGPAALAYLDAADFRPQPGGAVATPLDLDHPRVRQFLLAADADDLEESGIQEVTTPAFSVCEQGQVVAAAGYRDWPCSTAHLSVLTASAARGRGLARTAASAAVAHAIEAGRLPQWRARPEASRRVARALGFRELGSQVSIRLGTVSGPR